VELPERLNVCALVCTSWRQAAQGASSSIVLMRSVTEERLASFQQWLEKYGSSVNNIKLVADEPGSPRDMLELAHLPCSNLSNLELCNFDLQLAPITGEGPFSESVPEPGVLSDATSLTCLALGTCLLCDTEGGLQRIQSLKGLRELWLCHVMSWTFDPTVFESLAADSEQAASEQADSEQAGSEQAQSDQAASQEAESEQAASEQAASEQTDSEQAESEEADMAAGPVADAAALPDDIVHLDDLISDDDDPGWSISRVNLPGEVLAALSQLTKLVLCDTAADPWNTLQHISCLTGLQYLHLADLCQRVPQLDPSEAFAAPEAATAGAADTLAGIGQLQQLTHLVLKDVPGTFSKSYLADQRSPQNILTALQHLHIEQVAFEPAILEGLTGLTHLWLTRVSWVVGVHDFPVGQTRPPTEGRGAYKLLLVLPALQQLQELRLDIRDWPEAADQLPAYSALTSNSNLERLQLHNKIAERMGSGWVRVFPAQCPLPTAAWKHVFRQGLQLPGIAGLDLGMLAQAPRTFEDRLLSCCPTVGGAPEHERFLRYEGSNLELVCDDRMPQSDVRLLEVNQGDAAGVPAVLSALTSLSIGFSGTYHSFAIQSKPESVIAKLLQQASSRTRARK